MEIGIVAKTMSLFYYAAWYPAMAIGWILFVLFLSVLIIASVVGLSLLFDHICDKIYEKITGRVRL